MVDNNEGLTGTYNQFHDPTVRSPGIQRLRELHAAMDRAVLHAYGWDDVPTACEFILDHDDAADEDSGVPSRRRKPFRLRWPDAVRDDVLARLLDLNAQRAAEERGDAPPAKGSATTTEPATPKPRAPRAAKAATQTEESAGPRPALGALFNQRRD